MGYKVRRVFMEKSWGLHMDQLVTLGCQDFKGTKGCMVMKENTAFQVSPVC